MILKELKKIRRNARKKPPTEKELKPSQSHYQLLAHLHNIIKPSLYVEIGVNLGHSIILTNKNTRAIGIDPADICQFRLENNVKMFYETSDDFFAKRNVERMFDNKKIDFAFIDGMHLFEYVLRDFINIEKHSHENTIISLHDCIPFDAETSTREMKEGPWTGDVFKIILILKKYRPDLEVYNFSNLCVIKNVDCKNTVLQDNYKKIIDEYTNLTYNDIAEDFNSKLSTIIKPNNEIIEDLQSIIGRSKQEVR